MTRFKAFRARIKPGGTLEGLGGLGYKSDTINHVEVQTILNITLHIDRTHLLSALGSFQAAVLLPVNVWHILELRFTFEGIRFPDRSKTLLRTYVRSAKILIDLSHLSRFSAKICESLCDWTQLPGAGRASV